jgi:hypothetical protein
MDIARNTSIRDCSKNLPKFTDPPRNSPRIVDDDRPLILHRARAEHPPCDRLVAFAGRVALLALPRSLHQFPHASISTMRGRP